MKALTIAEPEENVMDHDAGNQGIDRNKVSSSGGGNYEIRIQGYLNQSWSDWMEGLEIGMAENGETVLSGPVRDQAALFGILNRLFSLNVTLLSVNRRD